ncbi:MAG TPA: hypothetical protein VHD87_03470 [Acidimicrobiales bacterium]|nr:hypothetical protein [Acidimicrobiales bacterium]
MDVLARIEEIVAKAVAAGEPTLPRNLTSRVTVLLREQLATQAEREQVVAQATSSFAQRYAPQLHSALERAAADAPQPAPPPAIESTPARSAAPRTPRSASAPKRPSPSGRRVTTRVVDAAARQLSRVPEGLIVFYQGVGATIEPPGMVLEDGKAFDSPTPAAMWVNRGEPVSGWSVWKLADGRSLQECWDAGDWPTP